MKIIADSNEKRFAELNKFKYKGLLKKFNKLFTSPNISTKNKYTAATLCLKLGGIPFSNNLTSTGPRCEYLWYTKSKVFQSNKPILNRIIHEIENSCNNCIKWSLLYYLNRIQKYYKQIIYPLTEEENELMYVGIFCMFCIVCNIII